MRSMLHIRTTGFYCKACPKVVEKALRSERGVFDVMAVHTMGLTSVMYDPEITDAESLCSRIRSTGFGAAVYCPQDNQPCASPSEDNRHEEEMGEAHGA